MTKKTLVSVITRTKNRPEFLREAAASVAAQTLEGVQHVVVNDGGVDIEDVMKPFKGAVEVTVLSPGIVGRCKAGNLGLLAAKGEWIAWLDDDDLYEPTHLQSLLEGARGSSLKVVYSDAWLVRQTRDPVTGRYQDVSREEAPVFEWSKIALWRRGDLHLVTVLHHRECTDRLGGFDETIPVLEDLEMFARFAQDYDFHHVRRRTATYRIRDDGTNAVTAMRREFLETRALLYKRYAHIVLPELLGMVETGHAEILAMRQRIAALEAELARLRAEEAP